MNIIGKTNQYIVYVVKKESPFALDEYYTIDDPTNNSPICRIIESFEYSSVSSIDLEDESAISDLRQLGFDDSYKDKIYIGKAKIEEEIQLPVKSLANLLSPSFEQIKNIIFKGDYNRGLTFGIVRGSNYMYNKLPDELKSISPMLVNGKIEEQKDIPFIFDIFSFSQFPHLGLFGGSGSGKTYGLNVIIEEIMKKRIPNIILDPHYELNFSKLRKDVPDELKFNYNLTHEIFQVGKNIGINFSELSTDELINIIQFSGQLSQPMVSALRVLHEYGDTFTLLKDRMDRLIDLFEKDEKRVLKEDELDPHDLAFYRKYKTSISGSATLRALQWRVKSLENEGIFTKNIDEVERALKQRKTVVLRGTNRHLNMLASYMFRKFYLKRRNYIDSKELMRDTESFPPFVVTMDEAHIFAPNTNSISPTKQILKTIAQEGRKYGVFEILATQRPAILDDTIISQLSTKIVFRTTISEDLEKIRKETDLTDQEINRLPYFNSGNAFVSSAILGRTVSIRFRSNFTEDKTSIHPFEELSEYDTDEKINSVILNELPFTDDKLMDILDKASRKVGRIVNLKELEDCIDILVSRKEVKREKTPFGFYYESTKKNKD